jgi:anti-sigma regulatory factor (Ser/Thr protein kinase)
MPQTIAPAIPPSASMMRWCRAFSGRPEQARAARGFVGCLLADSAILDNAEQVAAELVANAIEHSRSGLPGGLVLVEVCRWRGSMAIAVTDQGDRPDYPSGPIEIGDDPLADHGRGLRIVNELADSWGVRGGAHGRIITAMFAAPG